MYIHNLVQIVFILFLSGQQYNKYGNRVKWWTDYSIQNFKERTQCFVNQYNQYTLQGYKVG